MKKTIIALSAALVAVAGSASAEGWTRDGLYTSVKAGATKAQNQSFDTIYDTGFTGGAAVGVKDGAMRAELEGIYEQSSVDGAPGETQFYGVMANGFYDFKNTTAFTPYVGAGIGYGKVRYSSESAAPSSSEDALAYQGIAGVGYELNPCWTLTGEYRYLGTTKEASTRYQSHSAIAGVRYTF